MVSKTSQSIQPAARGLTSAVAKPVWLAKDWAIAAILAVISLITRLPFTSQILYHWDSVNFAFAMQKFDLAKDQPQPPGYILYVWLTRGVNLFFHDAQTTMVAITVVASLLAVVGIYFLGKAMFNQTTGILAGLFLAFSPLFWFYGEIALPHTLDALMVIAGSWCLYETMRGRSGYVYPAVVIMAVGGGFRQQTLVFMAPLILFAVRKTPLKKLIPAVLVGVLICLAWFIPLIALSGGLSRYLQTMNEFSARFQSTTSLFMGAGLFGLKRNITKYVLYTAYGWSFFALPLIPFVWGAIRKTIKIDVFEKWIFLALWVAPATGYYLLVHMGQQGLVFVYLPALILAGAVALETILRNHTRWLTATAAVLVLVNAAIFLVLPEYPFGPASQRFLTRATLVNSDNYFNTRISAIKRSYNPDNTVIIASNWHHLQYYLPGYKVLPFNVGAKWEIDEGAPVDNNGNTLNQDAFGLGLTPPAGEKTAVIVFDPELSSFNRSSADFKQVTLPDHNALQVATINPTDHIVVNLDSFSLVP